MNKIFFTSHVSHLTSHFSLLWSLFLLLVFALGIGPTLINIGGSRLLLSDIVFPILGLVWLVSLVAGWVKFRWHPLYIFLAAYFLAMLLSSIFSAAPTQSFIKLIGETYLLGLAVITLNLVNTPRRFKQTVCAWLIGTAVAVAVGIGTLVIFYAVPESPLLEYATSIYGAVPVGNYPRLTAGFVSASMFCNYLTVSFVILLIAGKLGWIKPVLYWALLIGVIVCSIFTISSGLGGIFLAAGCWYWYTSSDDRRFFRRAALISGIFVAAVFLAMNFIALAAYPTAPYAWQLPGTSIVLFPSSRFLVWSEALCTFADNFLTGNGLGRPSAGVIFRNTDGSISLLTDAHNFLLSVGAQSGIIGLLAIVTLCIYVLRTSFGSTFNDRCPAPDNALTDVRASASYVTAYGLGIAFLSAFVYQGMTGSFEDARHLWVLIGLISCQNRER